MGKVGFSDANFQIYGYVRHRHRFMAALFGKSWAIDLHMHNVECQSDFGMAVAESSSNFVGPGREERPLFIAKHVVEWEPALRSHQYSMTDSGVDDELLFGLAEIEGLLEHL